MVVNSRHWEIGNGREVPPVVFKIEGHSYEHINVEPKVLFIPKIKIKTVKPKYNRPRAQGFVDRDKLIVSLLKKGIQRETIYKRVVKFSEENKDILTTLTFFSFRSLIRNLKYENDITVVAVVPDDNLKRYNFILKSIIDRVPYNTLYSQTKKMTDKSSLIKNELTENAFYRLVCRVKRENKDKLFDIMPRAYKIKMLVEQGLEVNEICEKIKISRKQYFETIGNAKRNKKSVDSKSC